MVYAATDPAAAIEKNSSYIKFNKEMFELYNIHSLSAAFNVNNPKTFKFTPSIEVDGKIQTLNLAKLIQGLGTNFTLKNCLDGCYFIYGSGWGPDRKRPSTLTYDKNKVGAKEYQYLGYDVAGTYYDNPAYPWMKWDGKPMKDLSFIKYPWNNPTVKNKYNISEISGVLSMSNMKARGKIVDLTKNIKTGIYAKYIGLDAKDTVQDGGTASSNFEKSLYFGKVLSDSQKKNILNNINDSTIFPNPTVFSTKGGTWQDYVYILTPPTSTTWGSGFIFYTDPTAVQGVNYRTVPIAPNDMIPIQPIKLSFSQITGCFLSTPKKVYNSKTKKYEMKTWIIRSLKNEITTTGTIKMQIWLKKNASDENEFVNDNMGTKIFDEDIEFTPEHPYWVKEITYPMPSKGHESGIFVFDGGTGTPAYNYVWRTDFDTLAYGTHSTSKEADFDGLPWAKLKAEYGIEREKPGEY